MVSFGLAWLEQESVVTHFTITITIIILLKSGEKHISFAIIVDHINLIFLFEKKLINLQYLIRHVKIRMKLLS